MCKTNQTKEVPVWAAVCSSFRPSCTSRAAVCIPVCPGQYQQECDGLQCKFKYECLCKNIPNRQHRGSRSFSAVSRRQPRTRVNNSRSKQMGNTVTASPPVPQSLCLCVVSGNYDVTVKLTSLFKMSLNSCKGKRMRCAGSL